VATPAATHAIVIGVGDYPHLPGGSGTLLLDHQNLGQLSSPPVSARSLADWLIREFDHPTKPLASLRLLVSEAEPASYTHPISGEVHQPCAATVDAVTSALVEWKSAGDSNPDNLLLFYFCGHGIAGGMELALLCRDFGANPDNPLEGALDFRKLHLGMKARCKADEVCYFVDACRSGAELTRYAEGFAGVVPFLPGPVQGRRAPVFYSTLMGDQAFGRANKPSYFADALLRGLGGLGSDRNEGHWQVSTTQLKKAIDAELSRREGSGSNQQIPSTDDLTTFVLHRLKGPPEVPVVVACAPREANAEATLSCRRGGEVLHQRPPAPLPWKLRLRAGSYEFEADFAASAPFRACVDEYYVCPPFQTVPLAVVK